jgi:hypothetical protein
MNKEIVWLKWASALILIEKLFSYELLRASNPILVPSHLTLEIPVARER